MSRLLQCWNDISLITRGKKGIVQVSADEMLKLNSLWHDMLCRFERKWERYGYTFIAFTGTHRIMFLFAAEKGIFFSVYDSDTLTVLTGWLYGGSKRQSKTTFRHYKEDTTEDFSYTILIIDSQSQILKNLILNLVDFSGKSFKTLFLMFQS